MYSESERQLMLAVARESIQHGVSHDRPLMISAQDYPATLQQHRATFVTLHKAGELRGCIGTLQAHQPLIVDVVEHAYAAAFSDPRFAAVSAAEVDRLDIHISVLNPAEEMTFDSEDDLIAQLRPGIDGLILEDGERRSTFLPSVWESLPAPRDFFTHLKTKAELPRDYWSSTLRVQRYTAEDIG